MTPTKIVLERIQTHIQLRVYAPETQKGSTVIESVPFKDAATVRGVAVAPVRGRDRGRAG